MHSRRGFLTVVVMGGLSGCAGISERVLGDVGTPKTETMIKEFEGPKVERVESVEDGITEKWETIIKRIEFYESGAAKIYPTSEHGCFDAMALKHAITDLPMGSGGVDTSDALATVELGDFDETLTIDMAGAITNKGNYPSRTFEFRFYSTEGACISPSESVEFDVPNSYMPE